MDERPRSRSVPRWRAKLVETPLEPQSEPVALMVNVNHDPHAWARGSAELRPLPDLDRHMPPSDRDVLTAGGRWLLFARDRWSEDESLPYHQRTFNLGVYRFCFATGEVQRAGFDPRSKNENVLRFAASPDGGNVLVAQYWTEQEPGRPPRVKGEAPRYHLARCTLSFATFTSAPAREVLTIAGYVFEDADDLPVQWSPDGTKVAIALSYYQGEQVLDHNRVLILDAETGTEVTSVEDVSLAGSASWSPDSQQLLVMDFSRTLWTCDLVTEKRTLIPALPGPRPGTWVNGSPRLLGFADDHRMLVAVQRRTTMTISTIDPQTGTTEGLIQWSGAEDMYPTISSMPPGYWDQVGP